MLHPYYAKVILLCPSMQKFSTFFPFMLNFWSFVQVMQSYLLMPSFVLIMLHFWIFAKVIRFCLFCPTYVPVLNFYQSYSFMPNFVLVMF
jgi:hypothetical protein